MLTFEDIRTSHAPGGCLGATYGGARCDERLIVGAEWHWSEWSRAWPY
jgi:hypothetical protein